MEKLPVLRYTSSLIASAAILLLIYLLFLLFKPFATPLIFAGVMVVLFYPIHTWFKRYMPNFLASFLSTIIVLVIIIIPAIAIATGIVNETIGLAQTISSVPVKQLMVQAHTQAARIGIDLDATMSDVPQRIAGVAGKLASQVIGDVWSIVIGIVVALIATFFFFRDGEGALTIFIQALPINPKGSRSFIKEIGMMIKSNFAASLASASIQGTAGIFL